MMPLLEIAAIAAASISAHQADASVPLRLSVEQDGGVTVIRVVGLSKDPCSVGYALEVTDKKGGNRSVQRGTADLQANAEAILATVRLNSPITNVAATLSVTSQGAPQYSRTFDVSR